jgi:hypothetical protein
MSIAPASAAAAWYGTCGLVSVLKLAAKLAALMFIRSSRVVSVSDQGVVPSTNDPRLPRRLEYSGAVMHVVNSIAFT